MTDLLGDVLSAISEPPWPLVVLILGILFIYRKQVPTMFSRVKRFKGLGFEIEFHESLARLQQDAAKAASDVASAPQTIALSGTFHRQQR